MVKPTAGDTTPCQTPMIENPNVNPLFESVRQAMGLNTNITEEIPIRLPCGFSSISKVAQKRLPDWLCSVIQEDTGKTKLAEYFQKIETEEKKRLALLMLPQAMRSGRTTEYSIGAGIEKGLKNRYNNIWPFDHTRVKIREFPTSSDDYINASFLKSPLSGNKTYIATQGPLPSTFQDFWNVIWEQNSRVIVMLTREFEMGRIKCHRYWPTAQEPVLDLESVRVTFLSEYLPDGNDETVLVRQMKIGRPNSPQEQERTITQIQYTGWPDFGVPETPIEVLKIVKLANQHNTIDGNNNQASPYMSSSSNTTGPMVVHCSAGCGRTGAFCVIDSLLTEQQQQQGGGRSLPPTTDAVFQTVSVFREQRLSMVQTLRQYVFCYEALLWNLAFELSPHLSSRVLPSRATVMPIPTPHLTAFQPTKSTSDADFSYFG
ncbi:hypothetical protein BGZ83_002843 [Gryganskiella cystojenkinii]|nr:hypothetical protein BGZ83_002843 [Gryganskiella cystojenkinii]